MFFQPTHRVPCFRGYDTAYMYSNGKVNKMHKSPAPNLLCVYDHECDISINMLNINYTFVNIGGRRFPPFILIL